MTRDARHDDAPTQNGGRPRRTWPWVALAVATVMALPLTWLLAHRLSSRSFPPAPWSQSELPAIPAAAENGLDDVVLPGSWRLSTVDEDLIDVLRPLEHQAPSARWAQIEAESARLGAWMEVDAERELRDGELAQVDAVLAAPQFADPCSSVGSECRMLQLVNLTRFALVADLDGALGGDWPAAFTRARALLRASNELLRTARTMLANAVALLFARLATDHARVLVAGYRAEAARGPARTELAELRPTLDAIATSLDALDRTDVSGRRAIIAECHWIRDTFIPVLEDPAANGAPGGLLAPYLVDVRGTIAASDARFVALMRWVEAPDHATRAPPPTREYASGTGWWLWNPGGKWILDIGGFDLSSVVGRLDRDADALFLSRDALRRELSGLQSGT